MCLLRGGVPWETHVGTISSSLLRPLGPKQKDLCPEAGDQPCPRPEFLGLISRRGALLVTLVGTRAIVSTSP